MTNKGMIAKETPGRGGEMFDLCDELLKVNKIISTPRDQQCSVCLGKFTANNVFVLVDGSLMCRDCLTEEEQQ